MILRQNFLVAYYWVLLGVTRTTAARGFAIAARPSVPTTTTTSSSSTHSPRRARVVASMSPSILLFTALRGGGDGGGDGDDSEFIPQQEHEQQERVEELHSQATTTTTTDNIHITASGETATSSAAIAFPAMTVLSTLASCYAKQLEVAPIRTKSLTAGLVFALSDFLAQRLDMKRSSSSSDKDNKKKTIDRTRLFTSMAVGLLYFGPAAHYWYEAVFHLLPGTTLVSILQKAALGQLIFGPTFTCIFFATSLWQAGKFSLGNWGRKIRQDLPSAWMAGVGFWPLVDLISFSFISKEYIPLFVNLCSLVWTIFLSLVANR